MKSFALSLLLMPVLSGCFFIGQVNDKLNEEKIIVSDRSTEEELMVRNLCAANALFAPPSNGKQNGTVEQRLPNGLTMRYPVKNGVVSEIQMLYPNGNVETATKFKKGYAHGSSYGYYPNGKQRTLFEYEQGYVKQYTVYNEQGSIRFRGKPVCC